MLWKQSYETSNPFMNKLYQNKKTIYSYQQMSAIRIELKSLSYFIQNFKFFNNVLSFLVIRETT